MKGSIDDMKTHGAVIAEEINGDPSFRQEWEATELARIVAAEVIRYRAIHKLSQRKLAGILNMSQPQVARIESGEHIPEFATLIKLSRTLKVEFMIDIAPTTKRAPAFVSKKARDKYETREIEGVSVLVAAA